MHHMPDVRLRRIYDEPSEDDGIRVLVDRRWPRGVSKVRADIDEWCSDVAPSDDLRRWFGHVASRFDEFEARYLDELEEPGRARAFAHLAAMGAHDRLTLLTATRDVDRSQAAILRGLLTAAGPRLGSDLPRSGNKTGDEQPIGTLARPVGTSEDEEEVVRPS